MIKTLGHKSLITRITGTRHNLIGVGLRGVTLAGKFILVAYLTKYLSLVELGIYGLFVSTVLLSLYLVGFDFYTFATREILAKSVDERPLLIRDQAIFHGIVYILVIPSLFLVFITGVLPWNLAIWFYWILIATHIAQEIHRILITLSHPVAAYAIAAVAHGLWIFPVIAVGLIFPSMRSLNVVLFSWGLGASLAVVSGLILLHHWKMIILSLESVNWRWIRTGIQICYKFLVASIAYRVIDLSDRYFIQFFWGEAKVGIYTLYASIANVLQDFVFTGIVAVIFPLMIASMERNDFQGYRHYLKRLKTEVVIGSVVLGSLLIAVLYLFLYLVGREEFYAEISSFFVLLLSSFFLNISLIPHYVLYAQKRDNQILIAVLIGVGLNIFLNSLWIPDHGLGGAAWATLLSFGCVGLVKYSFSRSRHVIGVDTKQDES